MVADESRAGAAMITHHASVHQVHEAACADSQIDASWSCRCSPTCSGWPCWMDWCAVWSPAHSTQSSHCMATLSHTHTHTHTHRLSGWPIPPELLHVSLITKGNFWQLLWQHYHTLDDTPFLSLNQQCQSTEERQVSWLGTSCWVMNTVMAVPSTGNTNTASWLQKMSNWTKCKLLTNNRNFLTKISGFTEEGVFNNTWNFHLNIFTASRITAAFTIFYFLFQITTNKWAVTCNVHCWTSLNSFSQSTL